MPFFRIYVIVQIESVSMPWNAFGMKVNVSQNERISDTMPEAFMYSLVLKERHGSLIWNLDPSIACPM